MGMIRDYLFSKTVSRNNKGQVILPPMPSIKSLEKIKKINNDNAS